MPAIVPDSVRAAVGQPAGADRQIWLAASAEVAAAILAGEPEDAPQLVATAARRVADADLAAVETLARPHAVLVEAFDGAFDGPDGAALRGRVLPGGAAVLCQEVSAGGCGVLIEDASADQRAAAAPTVAGRSIGPLMAVPLAAGEHPAGVLLIGNRRGRPPFAGADLAMAEAFAHLAGLARELAGLRRRQLRPAGFEDRDRIARELHDLVIGRLFATGLQLQGLAPSVSPAVAEQLDAATQHLDQTINDIRGAIFALRRLPTDPPSLRGRLLEVADEASGSLGFRPQLRFDGPLDHLAPPDLHRPLTAALREALSGVARHAAARAEVLVQTSRAELLLRISDDGREPAVRTQDAELVMLHRHADHLGGRLETLPGLDGRGLTVVWRIPLRRSPPPAPG